ncbi:hypothetical protein G6011_02500 [Alternaria panax]|uniref:Uncharacterized protein n=1 Tax=Alternaria panax TaxID=48097 RepID=A0AAD4FEA2_9PLEO|nr:hypothetical protein G6011_02500 [Alternaria panax]
MAKEPTSGHARADSATNEIDPITKTLVTAQDFHTAVSSLASHDGFKALTEVLDLLPLRENDIKSRNDAIRDLENRLAAQNESHKEHTQKRMSEYEDRFKGWFQEKSVLENRARELEEVSHVKDEALAVLRENLETSKSKIEDLEGDITQKNTRLEEISQRAGMLEGRLHMIEVVENNHSKEVDRLRGEVAAVKKSLEDSEKNNQTLEEKAAKTKKVLDYHLQYSVEMTKLNLSETINRIEDLWQSAIQLIADFVGQELPKDVLQLDWNELRKKDVFRDRIPLPQSNSNIAKMMRVAMVLGAFATLVDTFVFQPTYLLDENSGLRDILCHQASIDPGKERFTRGILLSMSSNAQDEDAKEEEDVVGLVVDKLLNNEIVRVLLAPEDIPTFENELEHLVMQFQDEWRIVQHGKQKLEVSFRHPPTTDHPWHVIDNTTRNIKAEQGQKAPFDTSILEEDNTVIIPRVYLIRTESEPIPKTHGYVLRKSHLDAADEEARKDLRSVPFARATSGRQHRRRSFRAPAVTNQAPSSSSV